MKRKIIKIFLWLVSVVIVLIACLFFLGFYREEIERYLEKRRDEKFMKMAEEQEQKYLELQKNDNYGGKTPEETLDLYIKALEAGDIVLASKYYEISLENPNLQTQEVEDLQNVVKRDGNLDLVIENVRKIKSLGIKHFWSDNEVSFTYKFITEKEIISTSTISMEEIVTVIPQGTELEMGEALNLNPYTKIWKIIQ